MATAKMKILLPLVVWVWLHSQTTAQSFSGIGRGIRREIFFLNLEDGYFGCQVNESTDVLQLFELSKLCDGVPNCFLGSDELRNELKCTDDCRKDDGTECQNGACLDNECHCNDGFGGCSCEVPDENECKYRPCDVFAHCTNTLGSFSCTCFPGYQGDGFHCEDINECDDPAIAARCVENAECCNLPAHFLCKCREGFEGDGEALCVDIDECARPGACGHNAHCFNTPGNYTCVCPEGFIGNPYDGCIDVDECQNPNACGPGAICTNVAGGKQCICPPGYEGDAYSAGCHDVDECLRLPCGQNAICTNLDGTFSCTCPPGFIGDPNIGCSEAECNSDLDCPIEKACINLQCIDPCSLRGACGLNALCKTVMHRPTCSCPQCYVGAANTACQPDLKCLSTHPRPNDVQRCSSNTDCPRNLACNVETRECFNPCNNPSFRCKGNKKCEVHNHRVSCVCNNGFIVNERGEIACAPDQVECATDYDCPANRACIAGRCQNPCTSLKSPPCPQDKSCDVLNHKPVCICLKNCSPSLTICLRDKGCPPTMACRAFKCEDPCATASCPADSPCYVEDHKAVCKFCPPGFRSDAKYGCLKDITCHSHLDCSSQQACIYGKCQNPCVVANPCNLHQDCQVQDHQPVCLKVCQCQRATDCPGYGYICDGCNCVRPTPPGTTTGCEHCPPGVKCDPTTGACIKDTGTTPATLTETQPPLTKQPTISTITPEIIYTTQTERKTEMEFTSVPYAPNRTTTSTTAPEPGVVFTSEPITTPTPVVMTMVETEPTEITLLPKSTPEVTEGTTEVSTSPSIHTTIAVNTTEQLPVEVDGGEDEFSIGSTKPSVAPTTLKPETTTKEVLTTEGYTTKSPEDVEIFTKPLMQATTKAYAELTTGEGTTLGVEVFTKPPAETTTTNLATEEISTREETTTPKYYTSPTDNATHVIVTIPSGEIKTSFEYSTKVTPGIETATEQVVVSTIAGSTLRFGPEVFTKPPPSENINTTERSTIPEAVKTSIASGIDTTTSKMGETTIKITTQKVSITENTTEEAKTEKVVTVTEVETITKPSNKLEKITPGIAKTSTSSERETSSPKVEETTVEIATQKITDAEGTTAEAKTEIVMTMSGVETTTKLAFETTLEEEYVTPTRSTPGKVTGQEETTPKMAKTSTVSRKETSSPKFEETTIAITTQKITGTEGTTPETKTERVITVPGVETTKISSFETTLGEEYVTRSTPGKVTELEKTTPEIAKTSTVSRKETSSPRFEEGTIEITTQMITSIEGITAETKADRVITVPGIETTTKSAFEATLGEEYVTPTRSTPGKVTELEETTPEIAKTSTVSRKETSSPRFEEGTNEITTQKITSIDGITAENKTERVITAPGIGTTTKSAFETTLGVEYVTPTSSTTRKVTELEETTPGISKTSTISEIEPTSREPEDTTTEIITKMITSAESITEETKPAIAMTAPGIETTTKSAFETTKTEIYVTPTYSTPQGITELEETTPEFAKTSTVTGSGATSPRVEETTIEMTTQRVIATEGATAETKTERVGTEHGVETTTALTTEEIEKTTTTDKSTSTETVLHTTGNHVTEKEATGTTPTTVKTIPAEISMGQKTTSGEILRYTVTHQMAEITTTTPQVTNISEHITTTESISISKNVTDITTNLTKKTCSSDNDCNLYEACLNNTCVNPCTYKKGVCAQNAICTLHNHTTVCMCPEGYSGDPKRNCLQEPPLPKLHKCTSDFECLESEACYMSWCHNACEIPNICAETAKCQTKMHRPICTCPMGYEGNPAIKCFKPQAIGCTSHDDCPLTEACIGGACQRQCDVHNPCAQHAVCINTNHGSDCSCIEGYQGNGYIGCVPVLEGPPVCQYNEDCPPNKLCDRLNRRCINPCFEDSCGDNADCIAQNHRADCLCPPGFIGNPLVFCEKVQGCRSDNECSLSEACINGKCMSPCNCGINANCEVISHRASCKCPPGYTGTPTIECHPPINPCDPNPCGINALCELDHGSPICFCPKGLTGNPFKNCIPEGDECSPNPCGPNTGCRAVGGQAICFCLPEYEGSPPKVPCTLPVHPCDPSPCGPNTQCTVLANGFAKCTCLPGYLEDPNTIRGCVEPKNPCEPNPCGHNALCDPRREPVCFCPEGTIGNAFKSCGQPPATRCQPGPCGMNADCYVAASNQEQCFCKPGFIGDPYSGCRRRPESPCVPNPCSPGALCVISPSGQSMCQCPPGFGGDPTGPEGCHGYECLVDDDCSDKQSCVAHRCRDPCPGACGIYANCRAEKHHPICTCHPGLTGNPIIRCYPVPSEDETNPCLPSPCGLNTVCQVLANRAVCSCLPDFNGDPQFGCQPECTVNSDCQPEKACINSHCKNPCAAGDVCGLNAECRVEHHTATCACRNGYYGNAFIYCSPKPITTIPEQNISRPCIPSPCGPTDVCNAYDGQIAICDPCLGPNAIYDPKCRPECLMNSDCPFDKACIGQNCLDPCPGSCGFNALCSVVHHAPICSCPQGFNGNPFEQCVQQEEAREPETCENVRCGSNAYCLEENRSLTCKCKPGFIGNPFIICSPECVIDPDCPPTKACMNNKCVDPCSGVCGINAQCKAVHHSPVCYCPSGYSGDPFVSCYPYHPPVTPVPVPQNPCDPSPCGPFSRCLLSPQGYATCSCLPTYRGTPPACRPECIVNSECAPNRACVNQKCVDPCPGTCGVNALCAVINHNPICSCPSGLQGDPFTSCIHAIAPPERPRNPCDPSPCGPNSICQVRENRPVCSCVANYIGSPPHCRPECVTNNECPKNKACVQEKCVDPCINACGLNAECNIINHKAFCSCNRGYQGDAFIGCTKIDEIKKSPCSPSPCGQNTMCSVENDRAVCRCIPPYIGNPYTGGCKPECTTDAECPSHEACLSQYCRNPCEGLCGVNTECRVVNHKPICTCFPGFIGNPYTSCREEPRIQPPQPENPCQPSPCGPNSICHVTNGRPVCTCEIGFFGVPPRCRPECVVSSECSNDKACINQKCQDPCPGTCGLDARCEVVNHSPICSCPPQFTGDPFIKCFKEVQPPTTTPCIPSPCGLNAECRELDNRPVCSCLPGLLGAPPNCRPECVINQECPPHLSCINQKCNSPCDGSCGINAQCTVLNHRPVCLCLENFEGDPFSGCRRVAATAPTPTPSPSPCIPNPCGPNAECREKGQAAACYCNSGFEGNAYDKQRGCRRECETSDDCNTHLACVSFKCTDPCPGICGLYAECTVDNHIPRCSCLPGYTGNAFVQCKQIVMPSREPTDPCSPSPCGPNSQCRNVNGQAVCSCLPNYMGTPPQCRPECIVNAECPQDKACINQKCADPCPNTCGLNAQCYTKNHSPICACPPGFTGDPFIRCAPQPVPDQTTTERPPSCHPSPCGPNSQCQIRNGAPSCSCLPSFVGAPPNCRPECVINSECSSALACIQQRCKNPCEGSCGYNANCHVLNHLPICSCDEGYTGDPFAQCTLIPPATKRPEDPCNPSPCGPNARCDNGVCSCLPEFFGNPYESCRPECVISSECSRDKACTRNKCVNPCPGTCGLNARCDVINHIPTCSCPEGLTGDPFANCREIPIVKQPVNPCSPSPCGPNSICKVINDHAVCSCLLSFFGNPPNCKPECIVSAECPATKACVNQKCVDPCAGTCGLNARCEVINHSPICSCPETLTGDPFQRCYEPPTPPAPPPGRDQQDPCIPSPCGPNSICRNVGNSPQCECLPDYFGQPPSCRPECTINPDCPSTKACINNRCRDPCPGSCGQNTECRVISNSVSCSCISGYTGDPFVQCIPMTREEPKPCEPSPCGANAVCKERNGAGSCICLNDYHGNPYEGCRPECVLSSDCPTNRACVRNKCVDPCPGVCGQYAECQVVNHIPTCNCVKGYIGDAFVGCRLEPPPPTQPPPSNPCVPSPCGPNSICKNVNDHAVCSCESEYIGSPPNCKPECVVSSECPSNKACHKFKCANPCNGACGIGAKCEVINHNPICSCPRGLTGDPFARCFAEIPTPPQPAQEPCHPSPCGPNAECRAINGQPSCSCNPSYIGSPPNCRPECVVNTDCPSDKSCISEKCRDPCPGSCGFNAECRVQNHIPICTCIQGFIGDPFTQCSPKPIEEEPKLPEDPCRLQPCGPNALCNNGICTCLPEYFGDPYRGCRPECTMNTDCSPTKACSNSKCIDPCPGTCGTNAKCDVINHIPMCSCLPRYEGDPFTSCRVVQAPPKPLPCNPSPCGPNSICRVVNDLAVCSCQPGQIGSPPTCRPECVVSAECPLTQACLNNKCVDPCPGTCGVNAKCQVINHNPICSCVGGQTGDPFVRCYDKPEIPPPQQNPCDPSPCGPNALCQVRGENPACSCLPNYIGAPPNCRPECVINPECSSQLACVNQKCRDPCPGSCGPYAVCTVINHNPVCSCNPGYTGDPFVGCSEARAEPELSPKDPCSQLRCGSNARCRVENNYGICECLPEYHGNPYEGCRPECIGNSDCPMNRACIRNKCQDPCPGTCGFNAICDVRNHIPICSCPQGMAGDAFRQCTPIRKKDTPCNPSPCGLNTICRESDEQAICECLPGFFGNPTTTGCRPECTISADCPLNKACSNMKCIDPCPGVCGFNAICNVINHSPVCTCPVPLIGNPFTYCQEQIPEPDPCNPSPCRVNGQCQLVNGAAVCTYPECIINQDCPRDKACYNQKCRDPCRDACGINALCQAINHRSVCTCPTGYFGIPEIECKIQPIQPIPPPRPECRQDSECSNDKACINERCVDPCSSPGLCGSNAECRVQTHRAICICRAGFTGNAQTACIEIGCRTDTDCPPIQACVNRDCVDPCTFTQCGLNAFCRPDSFHRARCYCPDRFRGDPYVRCERPECTKDDECPYNLACRNERCEDPCECGPGALCTVYNHRAQCSCPPGYEGNPQLSCRRRELDVSECTMDADCPSKLACFSGTCKNPCLVVKPCGINAECMVVDTLPLRTMSCSCLPGYVGDADLECRRAVEKEEGCKSDPECPLTTACINRQCINPCVAANPCAPTAQCEPQNHKAICKCPTGLVGNPFIKCSEIPTTSPECTRDIDCPSDQACINQRCRDPCTTSNPCGTNSECRTSYHRPSCLCPDGWGGDPQVMCYKPECKINDDCPYSKACINENCLNPCTTTTCGRGAECVVQNHHAKCQCPLGMQGNPLQSCIAGVCQYNEDCADHEACDRLNRVCRPVCDDETCADNAVCIGRNHQPKCTCRPGTSGNPYIECTEPRHPLPSVECVSDSECPSQHACINSRCQNVCAFKDMCSQDQECRVWDTLPLRTLICECPADTFMDDAGRCRAIIISGCSIDSDCDDTMKCIRGNCINACIVDKCGINALCSERYHQSQCTCPTGYTGNPHVECSVPISPPVRPVQPECYSDGDCYNDQACRNQICVNPCAQDNPCAISALCSVNRHTAVCNCPIGYEGNPRIACVPPREAPTAGCKSNSDCAGTESCINARCASPCNCGPNADCRVSGHYPTCSCKPGYSGNPQTGCSKLECESDTDCANEKQCYNGQCVNPCILGNPCATNAECYGHNHRSNCRCLPGYMGNPIQKCELVECHVNNDCPSNRACIENHCINPCSSIANPPCAQNAICYVQNHIAGCRCPSDQPEGNPFSYCYKPIVVPGKPECELDMDCPSKLACIKNTCVNPCNALSPCHHSSQCSVLDTIPVRTMICTCPEGWVPNASDECHPVLIPSPGCVSDSDCHSNEACFNRVCRNPCNCGKHSVCIVENHRPVCSCENGYEGYPEIACYAVGCRSDAECQQGRSCINSQCVDPCLVDDQCGINAECYVSVYRADCRCLSGYRGNPYDRCHVVGCTSNSDCSNDKQCINAQCINPCVYDNPCSSRAECKVQNHMAVCRCPAGFIGNPYVDCRREPEPECRQDSECSSGLACVNQKCRNPCTVFLPCHTPSECQVADSVPVRTMICVCPSGYISSGSGTCQPTKPIQKIGCTADKDCSEDRACVRGICKNPCNCGRFADCRVKDHKPICTCKQGYDGNPEIECTKIGCRNDDDCSGQHSCINRQCVPACPADRSTCGRDAECYGANHRTVCECPPGLMGNPKISCITVGCKSNSDCPTTKACINNKCENPCAARKPCDRTAECRVFNHQPVCACPPGFIGDTSTGCVEIAKCKYDSDCPSQTACIAGECINPCTATEPCGRNAVCTVLDTEPVRTMICQCKEGYQGNAAVQCDKSIFCRIDKGYIEIDGKCICPPNTGLNENDECGRCLPERGFKIDERGRCVCNLEKGWIIDDRGNCVCPTEFGYKLDGLGNCEPITGCYSDDQCSDSKYCNLETRTCENPCLNPTSKKCGLNAFCNATNHRAICQCLDNYYGNAEDVCVPYKVIPPDFPPPQMNVKCLSDGVSVEIDFTKEEFNGVLYVKGHSKDEECRRSLTISSTDIDNRNQDFKVHFGSCGLVLVNGNASFILVIQKHPKLVTYKARAFHIKCIYQTGEQNVTLGFNVSMLTTAGTIANTGPPPVCTMKIVTQSTGQQISTAEIGDKLKLEVEVQPGSIYGGLARSCVATTVEGTVENKYDVTDADGCATDPRIFGEWDYDADTQTLQASFDAFKFPNSDNIRFQCSIKVCFGKCQPVNCRGYNAFGRRKRAIDDNDTDVAIPGDPMSGQLREEITIHSNTIFTFEKREERFADPAEAQYSQRVDDICVSMIGFIIALIITALLALVAVAVAVSCWLMAYRRRPKAAGPLPHPPEFPNPLFTTPEPMAEPSPDYLT